MRTFSYKVLILNSSPKIGEVPVRAEYGECAGGV